jgi:hypothetical protein
VIDSPAGNFVVTIGAPTAAIASLSAAEQVNVFGTLTVNGAAAFDGGGELSGTIGGTGTLTLGSPMTWHAGTVSLAGGLEVLNGQTLTLPGNNQTRVLSATSLRNHGTVVQNSATALLLQGGTTVAVTNETDGLWTTGDTTITSNGAGALTFANAGTLRKATGAGNLSLAGNIAYTNTGTLDVQSGVAHTDATLTSSGHLAVMAGATLYLANTTLTGTTTFSGGGTLYMPGTTTLTGTVTFTLPSELASGTLTGSGSLRLGAPMTWQGGIVSLAGGLEVLNGQTLTLPGNNQTRLLSATSLRNHGTVAMFSGSGLLWTGGTTVAVKNETDGLWTFTAGSFSFSANGPGTLSFVNAGTMQGAGSLSTTLNVSTLIGFSNTGTISGIDLQFF